MMPNRFLLLPFALFVGVSLLGSTPAGAQDEEAPDDLMDMLEDDAIFEGADTPATPPAEPNVDASSDASSEASSDASSQNPASADEGSPDGAPDAAPDGADAAPTTTTDPNAAPTEGDATDAAQSDPTSSTEGDPNGDAQTPPEGAASAGDEDGAAAVGATEDAANEAEALSFWPSTLGTAGWVGGTIFAALVTLLVTPAVGTYVALNFFTPAQQIPLAGGAVKMPTALLILLTYIVTVILPLPALLSLIVAGVSTIDYAMDGRTTAALASLLGIGAGCCVAGAGSSLVLIGTGMLLETDNFNRGRVTDLGLTEPIYLEPRSAVVGGGVALAGAAVSIAVPTVSALSSSGAAWLLGGEGGDASGEAKTTAPARAEEQAY